jgi:hypothetical protein
MAVAALQSRVARTGEEESNGKKSKICIYFYKGEVINDLVRWIHAVNIGRRSGSPRVTIAITPKDN